MAKQIRRIGECGVGHEQRACDVVEQPNTDQHGCFRRRRFGRGKHRLDGIARLQQGELEPHMEPPALAGQRL